MQYIPAKPEHMFELKNQTVYSFTYDTNKDMRYTFNSLGYRSDSEFVEQDPIIIFGNSLSFGLGIDITETYGSVLQERLHHPVYNMSWGAYAHTNYELLDFLKQVLEVATPRLVIFQLNNLNRFRENGVVNFNNPRDLVLSEYYRFYQEFRPIMDSYNIYPVHWDEQNFGVDFSWCKIYNKYHVDSVKTLPVLFGAKTHRLVAEKILQDIL